ncbi:MAG: chromosomal replication initiator protein DnaA, partial [Streptomyces sp.]
MADLPADLAAVWPRVLEQLLADGQGVEAKDQRWLRDCQPLVLVSGTALLGVPNEYAKGVLEGRLSPMISDALSRECQQPIRLAITVTGPATAPSAPAPADPSQAPTADERSQPHSQAPSQQAAPSVPAQHTPAPHDDGGGYDNSASGYDGGGYDGYANRDLPSPRPAYPDYPHPAQRTGAWPQPPREPYPPQHQQGPQQHQQQRYDQHYDQRQHAPQQRYERPQPPFDPYAHQRHPHPQHQVPPQGQPPAPRY